jgi:hypothetical protein
MPNDGRTGSLVSQRPIPTRRAKDGQYGNYKLGIEPTFLELFVQTLYVVVESCF